MLIYNDYIDNIFILKHILFFLRILNSHSLIYALGGRPGTWHHVPLARTTHTHHGLAHYLYHTLTLSDGQLCQQSLAYIISVTIPSNCLQRDLSASLTSHKHRETVIQHFYRLFSSVISCLILSNLWPGLWVPQCPRTRVHVQHVHRLFPACQSLTYFSESPSYKLYWWSAPGLSCSNYRWIASIFSVKVAREESEMV